MSSGDTSMMGGGQPFAETSWGLIQQCQDGDTPEREAGLESLFRRYWGPVYLFIRRNWDCDADRAKDLTQGESDGIEKLLASTREESIIQFDLPDLDQPVSEPEAQGDPDEVLERKGEAPSIVTSDFIEP